MAPGQIIKESYSIHSATLGHLQGVTVKTSSHSCHYFGGIPYALPPVGPYRFRNPRPLPPSYRFGNKANPGKFESSTSVCPQPTASGLLNEALWDEDCLQLNIYVPTVAPPPAGYPVFFYIHGGFLQFGSPNLAPETIAPLLSETAFKAIIVVPAYRVNAFGFLASRELQAEARSNGEPTGNQGFWDQRLALEWTARNIDTFGGNGDNISIGGYSAGAHSAYQQLAHELYFVPKERALIRRVVMWSNSPGVQPKSLPEHQKQFDELLKVLGIPESASASEKLSLLREISPRDLVAVQKTMKLHEFRAYSDDAFIAKDIITRINSGDLGRRMKARGIKLLNGECKDEHFLYQTWRTPSSSYGAVRERLCADYPESVVDKFMQFACGPDRHLPHGAGDWQEAFGKLYADMQVHGLERGFHHGLVKGGLKPGTDLLRYRIEWRAKCTSHLVPPEWGVTHLTDLAIWFWGSSDGQRLTEEDKAIARPWNEAFAMFVEGKTPNWGTTSAREMLRLTEDGETCIGNDDRWEYGQDVWNVVNGNRVCGIVSWIKSRL